MILRRMIAAAAACLLCVCGAAFAESGPAEEPCIVRFEMVRSTDLPTRTYEVFLLEDGYWLSRGDGAAQPLDTETVRALQQAAEEYDLRSWDGFSGSNPNVLDGESFRLGIEFSDGTAVEASGTNRFPPDYFTAAGTMETLLEEAPYERNFPTDGTYVYTDEAGGTLILELAEDETFTFSGVYEGSGNWFREGARIYLSEPDNRWQSYTLIPLTTGLVFLAEESDPVPGMQLPDAARFIRE